MKTTAEKIYTLKTQALHSNCILLRARMSLGTQPITTSTSIKPPKFSGAPLERQLASLSEPQIS